MFVVVSYDISDDKRRNKVFKTLKDYGQWVQYSVFECNHEDKDYIKLKHKLDNLIERNEDSIRFYFLCHRCKKNVERIGGVKPLDESTIII